MIKYLIRDQRSSIRHRTCVHERCPPAVLAERVLSAEDPTSGVKGHLEAEEQEEEKEGKDDAHAMTNVAQATLRMTRTLSLGQQLRRWHVRGVANVARMLHQSAAAALSAQYMEM